MARSSFDDSLGVSLAAFGLAVAVSIALKHLDFADSMVAFVFIGAAMGVLGHFARLQQWNSQLRRNIEAMRAERLASSASNYRLFIRPFGITGTMGSGIRKVGHFSLGPKIDFETTLAESLEPTGTLITFGRPDEHVGAGRITAAEKDWQERFAKLARSSKSIICVPSHHAGTLWEIGFLFNNDLLHKCIFLMPPTSMLRGLSDQLDWDLTQSAIWNSLSIHIPGYMPCGQIFQLDNHGALVASLLWTHQLADLVQMLEKQTLVP